ncbi:MAG TPA: hypothetical protein VHC19_23110 [Pirellulales bacterium]|nr:hypothetical protein [Pirellulales bacterium]
MIEQVLNSQHATASARRAYPVGLGLLVAAQLALAALFSPAGIRSGQWEAPGLPYPDFLVELASGAIVIHPLLLYPLWAGLGPGNVFRRYAITLLLCLATFGAYAIRGSFRNHSEPLAVPTIFLATSFSLTAFGFWAVRRFGKRRIGFSDDPPVRCRTSRRPVQFRLRHLFECMALAACVLAAYRFYFPDGFPAEWIAEWPQQFARIGRRMPMMIVTLLPTILLPWAALAVQGRGVRRLVVTTAAIIFWAGLDFGIVRFGGVVRAFIWPELVAIQLGATSAGLFSAIVLRTCGYRIHRVEHGTTPVAQCAS